MTTPTGRRRLTNEDTLASENAALRAQVEHLVLEGAERTRETDRVRRELGELKEEMAELRRAVLGS